MSRSTNDSIHTESGEAREATPKRPKIKKVQMTVSTHDQGVITEIAEVSVMTSWYMTSEARQKMYDLLESIS